MTDNALTEAFGGPEEDVVSTGRMDLVKLKRNSSSVSDVSNSSQLLWAAFGSLADFEDVELPSTQIALPDPDEAYISTSNVRRNDSGGSTASDATLVSEKVSLKRKRDTDITSPSKRRIHEVPVIDPENPLLDLPFVPEEEPVIIASYGPVLSQRLKQLPTGVQWEISRLVTSGEIKISEILFDDLQTLQGSNHEMAPLVSKTFRRKKETRQSAEKEDQHWREIHEKAFGQEIAARSPWAELDEEEKYLKISQYGALGFRLGNDMKVTNEIPSYYYGGRVHFNAKLAQCTSVPGTFRVVLETAVLDTSNRFARRFGSSRFLKLSIPSDILNSKRSELKHYLRRPFVLLDGVYRMFHTKDDNAYLVRTDEQFSSNKVLPASPDPDSPLRSLYDFLQWFNPMHLNADQSVAKWVDRFALGLSNSVPGLFLDECEIIEENDIFVPGYEADGKPPSEKIMTDGCGYINKTALRMIAQRWEAQTFPNAIQVRVGGAKGLLLQHPKEPSHLDPNIPRVWIRPSQMKIKFQRDEKLDPAHRVIDVLRLSHARISCSIAPEMIINLHHNGVKTDVFVRLMETGMKDVADKLMTWDGPDAMRRLFRNVCSGGGVIPERLARLAKGERRIRGFGELEEDEDNEMIDLESLFDDTLGKGSTAWWRDEISGCPSSLDETVADLLASGFSPLNSPICATKLREVFKNKLRAFRDKLKILIPDSAMAFIVPDPSDKMVLGPGEIFFSPTRPIIQPDGSETNVLTGPVLVGRYPCKIPSDIEKVQAVDCEELRQYRDIIIFSVRDYCQSPASRLAGGDYDGDKVIAIWQSEIVKNFKGSVLCQPPDDLLDSFIFGKEKISDFLVRAPGTDVDYHIRELYKYIIRPILVRAETGRYSIMHENSAYLHGYSDARTIRLAHMFCQCLDGPKAGLIGVRKDILNADLVAYFNYTAAPWRQKNADTGIDLKNHPKLARTSHKLGRFIMDVVREKIDKEADTYLAEFEDRISPTNNRKLYEFDLDLAKPWQRALSRAADDGAIGDAMRDELDLIKKHVEEVWTLRAKKFEELTRTHVNNNPRNSPSKRSGSPFSELPITVRQDFFRYFSAKFVAGPLGLRLFDESQVRELRASYVYVFSHGKGSKSQWRFPWEVAFGPLCDIKAKALGQSKTIIMSFYDVMVMHKSIAEKAPLKEPF